MNIKKDDCIVPATASFKAIKHVSLAKKDHHSKEIVEYVEWQSNKGRSRKKKIRVVHLEKVKSEHVFGREHVVWDVHTDEPSRWWVITEPTNLYSQQDFPSLDYTLSFHIGITARIASNATKVAPDQNKRRLASAYRMWENAARAIDAAREPEDFQAIGSICRETLIELVKSLQADLLKVPERAPAKSDVKNWIEIIADQYAAGSRNADLRKYLKNTTKDCWELTNWLTHSSSADLHDAQIVLDATVNVISMVNSAVTRSEAEAPERCPKCKSYCVDAIYEPDMDLDPPYVNVCERCDWNSMNG